ncbi:MAG TPA: hypothetical protein VN938_14090 [Xanthobacteraceae bacterium]|jgi:hypothetical protein|nr:hypothetical protein [Xanthobacteraceae bacterium]
MRVIFALPVSMLAWLAVAQAQTANWQNFAPPGGGFQVDMPCKSEVKSEQRNGHKVDTALCAFDKAKAGADLVFMVKYQGRSEAPGPDAQATLDNVVKVITEGGTLISKNSDDIGDYPARSFVMQDKDNDTYQWRIVITDKYFIEVLFLGPKDNALGQKYLDSFGVD